jgi:hypothetical protein
MLEAMLNGTALEATFGMMLRKANVETMQETAAWMTPGFLTNPGPKQWSTSSAACMQRLRSTIRHVRDARRDKSRSWHNMTRTKRRNELADPGGKEGVPDEKWRMQKTKSIEWMPITMAGHHDDFL